MRFLPITNNTVLDNSPSAFQLPVLVHIRCTEYCSRTVQTSLDALQCTPFSFMADGSIDPVETGMCFLNWSVYMYTIHTSINLLLYVLEMCLIVYGYKAANASSIVSAKTIYMALTCNIHLILLCWVFDIRYSTLKFNTHHRRIITHLHDGRNSLKLQFTLCWACWLVQWLSQLYEQVLKHCSLIVCVQSHVMHLYVMIMQWQITTGALEASLHFL